MHDLTERGIGLKVLTGQGAAIDTTTASGKLVFGIFAALAEFEREPISERTLAGLASARARGRNGGRPYKMTPAKLRLAMASMGQPGTRSAISAPNSASRGRPCTGTCRPAANCARTGQRSSQEARHAEPILEWRFSSGSAGGMAGPVTCGHSTLPGGE
ncbi:recombinase family protein [Pseudarthrobacter raffinosi]|uniref:recombinase family protein n=1 Tax=Pseudarthrobacter raffinosi TaxID=2953651 RepID=UPI00403F3AA6